MYSASRRLCAVPAYILVCKYRKFGQEGKVLKSFGHRNANVAKVLRFNGIFLIRQMGWVKCQLFTQEKPRLSICAAFQVKLCESPRIILTGSQGNFRNVGFVNHIYTQPMGVGAPFAPVVP